MTLTIQELLNQVFTVEDLMTPRQELRTVERQNLSTAPTLAGEEGFDLIPIIEQGRILGVWHNRATDIEPLTERWLITRDTSIPDLLDLFIRSGQPGFLVLHRQEVVGLVTPADLNKLPTRVYVYNLIGELELKLARMIQNHCKRDRTKLRQVFGEQLWERLSEENEELKRGNVDINPVQLLYLSDLLNIVIRQKELYTKLGFPSGTKVKETVGGLNELRKITMHLVRPLLQRLPEDLQTLQDRLRRVRELLQRLEGS